MSGAHSGLHRRSLRPVTEAERFSYEADGAVVLRGCLDPAWVRNLLPKVDRHMAEIREKPLQRWRDYADEGRFFMDVYMWTYDPAFRAFALDSPLGEIATSLMGVDETSIYYDQIFIKEPNTPSETKWHQDLPFWPLAGGDIVSLWVALTPVSREISGVEYVAGSHKWGKFYRAEFGEAEGRFANDAHEACPDFSARRDDPGIRLLSWALQPGDIVAHHSLTVHGASGNPSKTQRRAGLSVRYFGRDARWEPRPNTANPPGYDPALAGRHPHDPVHFPLVWRNSRSSTEADRSIWP